MKQIVTIVLCTLLTVGMYAQKVGYINSQAIIAELPQVKEANANIETLKKQLQKKGENMITNLQKKYQSLQEKQQKGQISPIELENEAKVLKTEEEKIAKFEQSSQQKIMEKSQQLLSPIQDKINAAIKAVAAEDGYDYIFDASAGSILYAEASTDLSTKVKAKLGL